MRSLKAWSESGMGSLFLAAHISMTNRYAHGSIGSNKVVPFKTEELHRSRIETRAPPPRSIAQRHGRQGSARSSAATNRSARGTCVGRGQRQSAPQGVSPPFREGWLTTPIGPSGEKFPPESVSDVVSG